MSKIKNLISPIHSKAIRLMEGGLVEIDGHVVKAVWINDCDCECYICEMDCLCHVGSPIHELCAEVSALARKSVYLELRKLD